MAKIIGGILALVSLVAALTTISLNFPKEPVSRAAFGLDKTVTLVTVNYDSETKTFYTGAATVEEVFAEVNIPLDRLDATIPERDASLNGDEQTINIKRAFPVRLVDASTETEVKTTNNKVADILNQYSINLAPEDLVFPKLNELVSANASITIKRAKNVKVLADGEVKEFKTQARTVGEVLNEAAVTLDDDDKVSPLPSDKVASGIDINVTRVNFDELVMSEDIDYQEIYEEDSTMWKGEEAVITAGEYGVIEKKYEVIYEDGEEVDRLFLNEEVVKEPQDRIIAIGTKVKQIASGDTKDGLATYFYGPTIAASTTFPIGTTVKVTNLANGESIVVTIDDTGAFGESILIDLRDDYFSQIASLSAGVIPVRIEEVY